MKFWWVSHNQTFLHEVGRGYLWAPQNKPLTGWTNMTLVTPGDIVFSFRGRKISAIGLATTRAFDAAKPAEFGKAGAYWDDLGWQVSVDFQPANLVIEPRNFMELIRPMLPEKHSPLQPNGDGNMIYLSSISQDLGNLLLSLTQSERLFAEVELDRLNYDEFKQDQLVLASLAATEKESLVLSRRGQGTFRRRVQIFEKSCRITGVDSQDLLVASHIKPWAAADNVERLDGNNGLFLSPHVDSLFDKGLISFTQKGEMLLSSRLDRDVLNRWHIDPLRNVGRFNQDQSFYLDFHTQNVFK